MEFCLSAGLSFAPALQVFNQRCDIRLFGVKARFCSRCRLLILAARGSDGLTRRESELRRRAFCLSPAKDNAVRDELSSVDSHGVPISLGELQ